MQRKKGNLGYRIFFHQDTDDEMKTNFLFDHGGRVRYNSYNYLNIVNCTIFIFIILLIYAACEKRAEVQTDPDKPAEFFLIKEYIYDKSRSEYYVIANLPRKLSESDIIRLVEDYNRRNITVDMIKANTYFQMFYRETEYLTREYQEGEPYPKNVQYIWNKDPGQQIRNHREDYLIDTTYFKARNGRSTSLYVWPIIRNGKRGKLIKRIPDIDDYFTRSDGNIPDMPDIEFEWELSNIQ
jgi:hypothetical protein